MFYTYLWLRENGTPYYVGKGSGNRAYSKWGHRVRKPSDCSKIIVQEFLSEEDAYFAEVFLIEYYGRLDDDIGCLANLTSGGENPPSQKGVKKTQEHKDKIRDSQKGSKGYWFGKSFPDEVKAKWSTQRLGRKQSAEHIAKRTASRLKTMYGLGESHARQKGAA